MDRQNLDSYLYFSWIEHQLAILISLIGDCLFVRCKEAVGVSKKDVMDCFECDDVGELKEHVGFKIEIDR